MKVYNLGCVHGHRFEGWFASEDDSRTQLAQQAIACPVCESTEVDRLPSAPRLNLGQGEVVPDPAAMQAQLLERLHAAAAKAEDVGDRFAEEARRIHREEIPERAIRGTASPGEYAALVEEGVEVMALPPSVLPKTTLH
ncbi:MAG TPA: DUF1178 family protein [Noviherbaspirillum sp.]|jgi:hypothetical protein|uniref:DUF1178 family protein n=1 Tax=Noviherbaspirillum sp. TaxID=1926288 RepID=UPI002F9401C1